MHYQKFHFKWNLINWYNPSGCQILFVWTEIREWTESKHRTLWKWNGIQISLKLSWKKILSIHWLKEWDTWAWMGHWTPKECFNREMVCTVKWKEIQFLGDQFLPFSLSVKTARSEPGERNLWWNENISFQSVPFEKSLKILDSILKNTRNNYFMPDHVDFNSSAVFYYTNMANTMWKNKIPVLGEAWNTNTGAIISFWYTVPPISEGLLLPSPPEMDWCTFHAGYLQILSLITSALYINNKITGLTSSSSFLVGSQFSLQVLHLKEK